MADVALTLDELVKVWFELPRDDHWPSVTSEGLWAVAVGAQAVRLDNTPWLARDVACGDLFRVRRADDGLLWATEKLRWSGRCTIRVVPLPDGALEGSGQRVIDAFAPLGVSGEGIEQYGMIALDIPSDVDLATVKRLLRAGQDDGRWTYEERCIGDAWLNADRDGPSDRPPHRPTR